MIWQIQLTPTAPYFLGNERSQRYNDNRTQRGLLEPYYIPSNTLLSQSAMFGILRYLGIREPAPDMTMTERDAAQVGTKSFDLYSPGGSFGKIRRISPLLLLDQAQKLRMLPAPGHLSAAYHKDKLHQYTGITTLQGERWLPDSYSSKNSTFGHFLLEDGTIQESPFSKIVRTGNGRREKALFKREFVVMKKGISFLYYAETEDDFQPSEERFVFAGRCKVPFAVQIDETKEAMTEDLLPKSLISGIDSGFPKEIQVNGVSRTGVCYAFFCSDTLFEGNPEDLRRACCLLMGTPREYRVFTTNYKAEKFIGSGDRRSPPHLQGRYRKREEVLRLLPAGTVMLYTEEQKATCSTLLGQSERFTHGQTAGFNCIHYF